MSIRTEYLLLSVPSNLKMFADLSSQIFLTIQCRIAVLFLGTWFSFTI